MMKITALLLIFSFTTLMTSGQETIHVSLMSIFTYPAEEFKEAVDNTISGIGVGVGGNLLFNPKGNKGYSPVFFGADFSYVTFGRDKQPGTSTAPPYKTTFNHYSISGASRVFLTDRGYGFTPFIDGTLGLKIFNTRTKIDKDLLGTIIDDQPEVIHTTNDNGLGYSLGLGFYNRKVREEAGGRTSFTLKLMYLWGDKTSYVKRGSVQIDPNQGIVTYETGYVKTNMFMMQLGVLFN